MPTHNPYKGLLSKLQEEHQAFRNLCTRLGIDPNLPEARAFELIGRALAPLQPEFKKRGRPPKNPFEQTDDELVSILVDKMKERGFAKTDEDALDQLKAIARNSPEDERFQRIMRPSDKTLENKVSKGRQARRMREQAALSPFGFEPPKK